MRRANVKSTAHLSGHNAEIKAICIEKYYWPYPCIKNGILLKIFYLEC